MKGKLKRRGDCDKGWKMRLRVKGMGMMKNGKVNVKEGAFYSMAVRREIQFLLISKPPSLLRL